MPVRAADDDEASKVENGANNSPVIAGFFTGGALAIRGGAKAARNSAIGCACLLAVIEGVGIGFQRMMAENTRLDVRMNLSPFRLLLINIFLATTTTPTRRKWTDWIPSYRISLSRPHYLMPYATNGIHTHSTLSVLRHESEGCVFSLG